MLLLDEPLANLDRELRKEMEVQVRRYQGEIGIPFIYVTHNQEEALTMSDRIAVMSQGRFEQVADKIEVYTHPATPFVAGFVGHANRMEGRLKVTDGDLARLDWNGLDVIVPRPGGAAVGSEVTYFVKCEKLSLASPNDPPLAGHNRLPATLRDVIFKGTTADYMVRLDNGGELIVTDAVALPAIGRDDPVHVVWPPAAGECFTRNGN